MMLTIESLANVILSMSSDVSNKKIQKLTYYVYAWYMAIYGVKIADIEFEAWEHGPVCRRLYNRYRSYGWNIIPQYRGFVLVDDEKIRFIQSVLNVYGNYTADELEKMTHKEQPWLEARAAGENSGMTNNVISDMSLKTYYSKQYLVREEILKYICE